MAVARHYGMTIPVVLAGRPGSPKTDSPSEPPAADDRSDQPSGSAAEKILHGLINEYSQVA
jgi:hypothetical protein